MDTPPAFIELGLYAHFKGPLYMVVGMSTDCDTQDPIVEYYPLYGEFKKSSQPLKRFLSSVNAVQDEQLAVFGEWHWTYRTASEEEIRRKQHCVMPRFRKITCSKEKSAVLAATLRS